MTTDDDRVAELAGDGGISLDPAEQAELEELRALLADPAVWAEPDPSPGRPCRLRHHSRSQPRTAGARPGARTRPPAAPRRAWTLAVAGVAAAALIALVAVVVLLRTTGTSPPAFRWRSPPAPGRGDATLTKSDSGWRIELDASDLPRLDGGRFYQAWMSNAAGMLVPVGTVQRGPRRDAAGRRLAARLPDVHRHPASRPTATRRRRVIGCSSPRYRSAAGERRPCRGRARGSSPRRSGCPRCGTTSTNRSRSSVEPVGRAACRGRGRPPAWPAPAPCSGPAAHLGRQRQRPRRAAPPAARPRRRGRCAAPRRPSPGGR